MILWALAVFSLISASGIMCRRHVLVIDLCIRSIRHAS